MYIHSHTHVCIFSKSALLSNNQFRHELYSILLFSKSAPMHTNTYSEYGVATISRLLQFIGLFGRILSLL